MYYGPFIKYFGKLLYYKMNKPLTTCYKKINSINNHPASHRVSFHQPIVDYFPLTAHPVVCYYVLVQQITANFLESFSIIGCVSLAFSCSFAYK